MPDPTTPTRSPEEIEQAAVRAAEKKAQAVEHQRLSAAIQARFSDPVCTIQWHALPAWQLLISMAREIWDRSHPRCYAAHIRFQAYRDAADAIARLAIGEA